MIHDYKKLCLISPRLHKPAIGWLGEGIWCPFPPNCTGLVGKIAFRTCHLFPLDHQRLKTLLCWWLLSWHLFPLDYTSLWGKVASFYATCWWLEHVSPLTIISYFGPATIEDFFDTLAIEMIYVKTGYESVIASVILINL